MGFIFKSGGLAFFGIWAFIRINTAHVLDNNVYFFQIFFDPVGLFILK